MGNKPDKKTYQIGFYVVVEVDAIDDLDAIHIADAACDWPGSYQPPLTPVKHTSTLYKVPVEALVTRSQPLMVKEIDDQTWRKEANG